jgi:hypothetical protein
MTRKAPRASKSKPKIDLYRYVIMAVLIFIMFVAFDIASDGDPNGLRGLTEFFRLMAGV